MELGQARFQAELMQVVVVSVLLTRPPNESVSQSVFFLQQSRRLQSLQFCQVARTKKPSRGINYRLSEKP